MDGAGEDSSTANVWGEEEDLVVCASSSTGSSLVSV